MMTIHELLEDPGFKKFFTTQPKLPSSLKGGDRYRWRIWAKIDNQWKKKDFKKYTDAFKYFAKIRHRVQDATICSPGLPFDPPYRIVRVKGKYMKNADGNFKRDSDGNKIQITKMVYWKPQMPIGETDDHNWCTYCRRPTVFRQFRRHHALNAKTLGGVGIDTGLLRCSICGSSENIVNLRKY